MVSPTGAESKPNARLRRSAEHFLSASAHAHGEGEVLSELNAETVLHYVIALEGLLTGEEQPGELTRKISQRAAVLAGEDDAQRLEIEETVRGAYAAAPAMRMALRLPRKTLTSRSCAKPSGAACLPGWSWATRRQSARSSRLRIRRCYRMRFLSAASASRLMSSGNVCEMSSIRPCRGMRRASIISHPVVRGDRVRI